ncbi:MAG: four helix bundle protein [Opitutaceae bacterium]|nr:four helix bundle protein [Opitutaceae bacterium]
MSDKKRLAMTDDSKQFRFLALVVWPEGRNLHQPVSRLVRRFPREGWFGLTSQRRCPARYACVNIAEGGGRNPDRDSAQFAEISHGSAMEVASDVFPAMDKGCVTEAEQQKILVQVAAFVSKGSGLYRRLTGVLPQGALRSALSVQPGPTP